MRIRACLSAVLVAVAAAGASYVPAGAQSAQAELESAGERLSVVTERYNDARIKRAKLDERLSKARTGLAHSESKLKELRGQLGTAVRDLYMHPAAGLATFFEAETFGEVQRGSVLAGHAVLSTDDILLNIRRVRAEQRSASSTLQQLRDEARRDELAINRDRKEAASAFARAQTLLAQANQSAREAARSARIAAAADYAAANITFDGPVRPSAMRAVRAAASQIGKPYRWGAAGPDSYDCSGLTMWSWAKAGVSLPHSSRAQYASLPHVSMSNLQPGDLVFRGSPIHHVGIYAGDGVVIAAPQSGETVRRDSVRGYSMAARP